MFSKPHKYTVTKEKSNAHPLTIKNKIKINTYIELGLGLLCLTSFSTIFQLYIMTVSFIGGGNRSTPKTHLPAAST
jgi:hypothetical protein